MFVITYRNKNKIFYMTKVTEKKNVIWEMKKEKAFQFETRRKAYDYKRKVAFSTHTILSSKVEEV